MFFAFVNLCNYSILGSLLPRTPSFSSFALGVTYLSTLGYYVFQPRFSLFSYPRLLFRLTFFKLTYPKQLVRPKLLFRRTIKCNSLILSRIFARTQEAWEKSAKVYANCKGWGWTWKAEIQILLYQSKRNWQTNDKEGIAVFHGWFHTWISSFFEDIVGLKELKSYG